MERILGTAFCQCDNKLIKYWWKCSTCSRLFLMELCLLRASFYQGFLFLDYIITCNINTNVKIFCKPSSNVAYESILNFLVVDNLPFYYINYSWLAGNALDTTVLVLILNKNVASKFAYENQVICLENMAKFGWKMQMFPV